MFASYLLTTMIIFLSQILITHQCYTHRDLQRLSTSSVKYWCTCFCTVKQNCWWTNDWETAKDHISVLSTKTLNSRRHTKLLKVMEDDTDFFYSFCAQNTPMTKRLNKNPLRLTLHPYYVTFHLKKGVRCALNALVPWTSACIQGP